LKIKEIVRYMPHLLDFENKRTHFKAELKNLKSEAGAARRLRVNVGRDNIFIESFQQLNSIAVKDMKAPMEITFKGEAGIDAGGVSRDYFIKLSQEMFNPNFALFSLTDNGVSFHPNTNSSINPDHLHFFRFVGRMIGKAIYDDMLLECHFSKPFYKMILGEDLSFEDVESLDNSIYKSPREYLKEEDVESLYAFFAVNHERFGKKEDYELIPGGQNIQVTNENVKEYVEKLSYFHMYEKVKDQIRNFTAGFYELIPKNLISVFNPNELELLIAGLPNFDIEDMKANTDYVGFSAQSNVVQWFWEIIG
jgi:E3 ubiquitin-protein ligase HUWE1